MFMPNGLVLFTTKEILEGDPKLLPPLYGGVGQGGNGLCMKRTRKKDREQDVETCRP